MGNPFFLFFFLIQKLRLRDVSINRAKITQLNEYGEEKNEIQ